MTDTFKAIVADEVDGKVKGQLKEITLADLPDEDVLISVSYSTLNYKDGLAVSGKGKICRSTPMVCGIDLAGTVEESRDPNFKPGDQVLVNGYGLSEKYWGGYAQKVRMKGEWLVRVPDALGRSPYYEAWESPFLLIFNFEVIAWDSITKNKIKGLIFHKRE